MKKILSLILCLVMVMSLAITGFAADDEAASAPTSGSGTNVDPFVLPALGSYVATINNGNYVYYTYKAEKDGKITITLDG